MNDNLPRFMAVDPGSKVVGWAVFEGERLIAHGTVHTKGQDYDKVATWIVARLADVRVKYLCTELAMEKTFMEPGHRAASLSFVEQAVRWWAKGHTARVDTYANNTWKKSVVGHGGASKADVRATIKLRFPNLPELTEHEYDAIAIGCHHAGIRKLEAMAEGGPD